MKIIRTAKYRDSIKGGISDDKKPEDFNKKDVEVGMCVEYEHTDNPDTAREISMDHLQEHKDYYKALEKMEEKLEDKK
ncbi:MAG: hypothetical protein J7L15_08685 [Clostridiales bacterium]|nr:hypothetical protein [Clostridiales bacterium]